MGVYFSAHAVSWWLWRVDLVAREIQRFAISVGQELAVHRAALHRTDRFRIYRLASVYGTFSHAGAIHVRERGAGFAKSAVPDVLRDRNTGFVIPSRRGHLEFSLQVGIGGHGARATCGGAVGCAGGRHL